jgi:hypothetical protein
MKNMSFLAVSAKNLAVVRANKRSQILPGLGCFMVF